jgi:hypothetical protein
VPPHPGESITLGNVKQVGTERDWGRPLQISVSIILAYSTKLKEYTVKINLSTPIPSVP